MKREKSEYVIIAIGVSSFFITGILSGSFFVNITSWKIGNGVLLFFALVSMLTAFPAAWIYVKKPWYDFLTGVHYPWNPLSKGWVLFCGIILSIASLISFIASIQNIKAGHPVEHYQGPCEVFWNPDPSKKERATGIRFIDGKYISDFKIEESRARLLMSQEIPKKFVPCKTNIDVYYNLIPKFIEFKDSSSSK